ncbi:hypothetical protein, partial [Flintibacter porci]|uniref:hypothetical protein n=1 Tax=Flintibacter porci TaxID=3342383 RepID=UPI003F891C01
VTSFYQSSANHVSFYTFFNLRNLLYLTFLCAGRFDGYMRSGFLLLHFSLNPTACPGFLEVMK